MKALKYIITQFKIPLLNGRRLNVIIRFSPPILGIWFGYKRNLNPCTITIGLFCIMIDYWY